MRASSPHFIRGRIVEPPEPLTVCRPIPHRQERLRRLIASLIELVETRSGCVGVEHAYVSRFDRDCAGTDPRLGSAESDHDPHQHGGEQAFQ